MELKEILAISGQPGLFKYIAPSAKGIIVEALADGRHTSVSSASKVSSLAEISVYTDEGDKPLSEIMTAMFEKSSGGEAISHRSTNDELKAFFAEVVPNYDRDMVRVSDMKKMVAWYNILVTAGMTDFSVEQPEQEGDGTAVEEAAAE